MKDLLKSIAVPSLLSFVVLLSMLNVYEGVGVFTFVGIFAINVALMCSYEKLRLYNKNWFSTIIVMLIYIIAGVIAIPLIRLAGRENAMNIVNWFFKSGDEELYIPLFTAALLTFFTPFISMTVFYFTNVRYRPVYLMLTCLITFAIYAKSLTPIPFIYPALIIAAFLLIAIERKWFAEVRDNSKYNKFVVTGVCFVATAAYIAALFPQAERTPYRENFDNFISQGRFATPLGFANIMDSSRSGRNNPNAMNLERTLFFVQFNENFEDFAPTVLRRQVFYTFNGDYWEYSDVRSGITQESDGVPEKFAIITIANDTSASIVPKVPWTYAISRLDTSMNYRGEFMATERLRRGKIYAVHFGEASLENDFPFLPEYFDLPNYFGRTQVRELALSITEGLDCDYEKAAAIERYFYSDCEELGKFVYDIRVSPPTMCAYTFLFETRRGTCSDFASAMTVLSREAGLPARYAEGYVLDERVSEGGSTRGSRYVVRVEHGHAFPEVYANGSWHIFEPTIPGGSGDGFNIEYEQLLIVLLSIAGIATGGLLFAIFALPRVRESAFRRRVRKSPRELGVRLVYKRIYSTVSRTVLPDETLSSREVSELVFDKYGVCLNSLVKNYDGVVYGELSCEYDCYGDYTAFKTAVLNYERQNKRQSRTRIQSRTSPNAEIV